MKRLAPRGFSLIELMVAGGIMALVLSAATAALLSQNDNYSREMGVREAQEQGRFALDYLQSQVRLAGFGIDPQLAFDFDYYNCNLGSTAGAQTQAARCAALSRDSATQSDELVLAYRDPYYAVNATTGCAGSPNLLGNVWLVTGVATGGASPTATISMRNGDSIRQGQILQIICQDAATYTYATVKAAASNATGACVSQAITLEGTLSVTGPTGTTLSPYSRSDLLSASCFSNGTARAFLVDRNRYFIYQDVSNAAHPRPLLMLDRGLDLNGDAALTDADLLPIASDIEDLQVAYVLDQVGILQTGAALTSLAGTYITDADANGVWGDTATKAEQLTTNAAATAPYNLAAAFTDANTYYGAPSATGIPCFNVSIAPYMSPCVMDKSTLELSGAGVHRYRWTAWPANITQVRLDLVSRGHLSGASLQGAATTTDLRYLPALENRAQVDLLPASQGGAGAGFYLPTQPYLYQHSYLSGAERPVNLTINGMFLF